MEMKRELKIMPPRKRIYNRNIGGALAVGSQKSEGQRYSIFSAASYLYDNEQKQQFLNKFGKEQWNVDKELTTNDATTFYNSNTKKAIVSIRGTDVKNIEDLMTDVALFFSVSRFTPRASMVSSLVDKAIKKYGRDNVIVVGHSLGGELARQMANKYKIKAVTYNRGSSFLDIFNKQNKNIISYTTNIKSNIDPVSILGKLYGKNTQLEFAPTKGVHSVENFLPTTAEEIKQTGTGLIIMKPR